MNAGACSATINFNIPSCGGVCTLTPATPLPAVTQPVTIDGYTQPGASANTLANGSDAVLLIEIDGTNVAPGNSGLSIAGGASTVRGLVVNRFASDTTVSPPVNGFGINITDAGGNTITGNFIGTDPTGASALGNERGIGVFSDNNLIGGPTADARNVVSGNGTGIHINSITAVLNVVQNNYIGVAADGNTALGNARFAGINIASSATETTVGGTTAGSANVIAANIPYNVRIRGSLTQNNVLEGNYIGTNAAGANLGGGGVAVESAASNNRIGGQAAGAGNTIAYNTTAGVTLANGAGNAILSNSIFGNAFGIDIGNDGVVLANDACDLDNGPNLAQNFPVITSVSGSGGNTTIAGMLDSAASTAFTVEFFDNISCDATGYGQGAALIGSRTMSTDGSCGVTFNETFSYALAAGHVVTATATDPSGNTSEFSACAGVCGDGAVGPGEQCDDGNAVDGDCCSSACQYEAVDASCGSSSSGQCDNPDTCDGAGACLANHVPDSTTCDDGTTCTTDDVCVAGTCTGDPVADETPCDDGSVCTEQDACAAGACTGSLLPQGTACTDDSNACTEDVCDAVGICQHVSPIGAYTLDADFDQGTLFNVNHTAPNNDQLQLSKPTAPFPFVNVAASDRGTVVRIDANGGQILGEYQTAPDSMGRNPSRTTVDQDGNVWVANRNEDSFSGGENKGSATRVGLLVGGTRTDASGTPDPNGQYVKPPFQYNTCIDRDGDGLLKTSRGLGNILPWTNAGSADTDGGVSTAEDECIINYTRVTGTATRTIAVDANNDVWVGGYGDLDHEKLSGVTGLPIPGTQFNLGCGGYGGLVDHNGVLWSAREQNGLLRFDTTTFTGACLGTAMGDYGLGIDPQTGDIWHSSYYQNKVCDITPAGTLVQCYPAPTSRGVAVDGSGNVWVVNSDTPALRHLRTDGTFVGDVTLPGGIFTTGVAVDTNGKVWVTNKGSDNVMRIDPSAGGLGGGGFPIGAVDMTVDLGLGAGPYNYSDMTGFVAIGTTSQQGTWTVTRDGGVAGNAWGPVSWNTEPQGSEPSGTSIVVEVRAADTVTALTSQLFTVVTNGAVSGVTGRFIEIRATLIASASGVSPVLSDLAVQVGCGETTCSADADCDDADECTIDACSPADPGANSFGCVYTGVVCTAPDACHDAVCNPVTAQCLTSVKPDGASCSDQDLCNGDEVCQGGTCTAGSPPDCDDGNDCSVDGCDSVSGCTHAPGDAGSSCGDPDDTACNAPDTCDGSGSCVDRKKDSGTLCLAGTGTCDPDDTCDGTTDTCAPVYAGGGTACDLDASVCTTDQCNGSGACKFVGDLNCDDGNVCTQDSCDPSGGCVNAAVPATGCNTTAAKAVLKIARDAVKDWKDRVQLTWTKGSAEMSEFGDPTTTTDYTLCVYDVSGGVVVLSVAGGADCDGRSCWTLTGPIGNETGIKYKDSRKPAVSDGVAAIKGKSGTTGKAKLVVKAKGTNVPAIDLGTELTCPVTAQLVTSDAACFEATFASGDEKTNDDAQFKAVHLER